MALGLKVLSLRIYTPSSVVSSSDEVLRIGELCHITIVPSSSRVNLDRPKPNVVLQFRVEVCTEVCKPLSESSSNVWEVFRASKILFT